VTNPITTLRKPVDVMDRLAKRYPRVFPLWKQLFDAGTAAYVADPVSNLSVSGHRIAEQFGVYIARHGIGQLLDIGCGPQPIPVYLARYPLADISGCDLLPPEAPHPFKFEFAVAEALPWPDASFDTVTVATSLDHAIDLNDALTEIERVLVPAGRLLLWVGFVAGAVPYDRDKEPASVDAYHMFHFDEGWFEDLLGQRFEIRDRTNIADNSWFYRYEKPASDLDRLAVKLDFGRRQIRGQIGGLESKLHSDRAALISGVTAERDALTRRLSDAEAEHAAIAQRLSAAEQAGSTLREAYEWIVERLISTTTTLASVQAERQSLSTQLASTTTTLASVQAELASITTTLASVHASTSWRITSPLRSAAVRRARGLASRGKSGLRLAARRAAARLSQGGALVLRRGGAHGLSVLIGVLGWWRLHFGRPRTMWGVTPILTLSQLGRCDRLLGFRSESLVFTVYHTTNFFDINLKRLSETIYAKCPRWSLAFHALVLRLALARFDVFHMFCDRGLLPPTRPIEINPHELQMIRRYGRRLYTYTYGADVRTRATTLALGRYNLCAECPDPGRFCICDDAEGSGNIGRIREHATAMIAMGDMLAYVPGAHNTSYWPIDVARFPQAIADWLPDRSLRIAHAPNHAHFKGTRYLTSAIERLQSEGWAIELVQVEGVANLEVIALFKSCDIIADQFIAGFHGYTAFEAMALGKPVLCYLRDPTIVLDPDNCPIINVWPDTVYDVLRRCLLGEFDLAELGRRSRGYVARYHSLEAVAARLGRLYLETAGFPQRINRRLERRIAELEAALPPVIPGPPPIAWNLAAEIERDPAPHTPADQSSMAVVEQCAEKYPVADWLREARPFHTVNNWSRRTRGREIVMLAVSELRIDPRVERGARALAAAGWQVRIVAPDLSRPSFAAEPFDWGPGISFHLLPSEAAGYVMHGPGLIDEEMYRRAAAFRPFAFHCHDLNTALIGLRAAAETGARWICDFHEWWSENVTWNAAKAAYEPHDPQKAAFYRWAERVCLRRADAVITVNRSIAVELERMVGAKSGRVAVIRNIPPLDATQTRVYRSLKAQFEVPAERFVVLYQGGTGPTRLLEPVIEALALAVNVTLVIRGPSLHLFGADYRRIAETAGVGERLVLADPVPSRDVVAAARGADAGLWTLPNLSRNFFYALPNKIFEYLASGLPLLVANFPEPKRIVDELGVGLTFDPYDPASIAEQMNLLAEDARFLARCREAVPRALTALDAGAEWQRLAALYDGLRRVVTTPGASAELAAS
jgi:glycosyltransferase involved in cell wall biosynthesis/SAM-dependent methyltransferase